MISFICAWSSFIRGFDIFSKDQGCEFMWRDHALDGGGVVDILGIAVAVLAAALSGFFAWRSANAENWSGRLDLWSAEDAFFSELREWAGGALLLLSEAVHLCDLDPAKAEGESVFCRRHRLRIELSAAVDKGRWFFTNVKIDDHGENKQVGFQGYRHEILDYLVDAYNLVGTMDYAEMRNNLTLRSRLAFVKRGFVGSVQSVFDPSKRSAEIMKIRRAVAADKDSE